MRDTWTEPLGDGREVRFSIWPAARSQGDGPRDPHLWQGSSNWHYAQGRVDGEPADTPMLFAGLPTRKVVQFNFWRRRAENS